MSARRNRSSGAVSDIETAFQSEDTWNKEKLPTKKDVLCYALYLHSFKEKTWSKVVRDVSTRLENWWTERNVYPVRNINIRKKVTTLIDGYKYLLKRREMCIEEPWCTKIREFVEESNKLLDIFCTDEKWREVKENKVGITMLQEDYDFYESMKGDRRVSCLKTPDLAWHDDVATRKAKFDKRLRRQNSNIGTEELDSSDEDDERIEVGVHGTQAPEDDQGTSVIRSDTDIVPIEVATDSILNSDDGQTNEHLSENPSGKKRQRKVLYAAVENDEDPLPKRFRHIRNTKKGVKDEFYQCCAELEGEGFSWREMQLAHKIIGKWMFNRNWRVPDETVNESDVEKEENVVNVVDEDCIPTQKAIRSAVNKIQTHRQKLVAQKMKQAKEEGSLLTLANDSTTRRIGTFNVAGIHVDKNEFYPLETALVGSETSKNVASTLSLSLEVMAEACGSNITSSELYDTIDVLMQDSTSHNKAVAGDLASIYEKSEKGSLFCDTHTVLGLDRGMTDVVAKIEGKMGLTSIFKGFLVSVDLDAKKDTISTGAVSWAMSLFGPDRASKPWSYHHDFKDTMKKQKIEVHLLSVKDNRFSGLSKTSSALVYHWDDFHRFLAQADYITNRLACLVRDALELEYILVVATVLALFGVHLITPMEMITVGKHSTHSSLKEVFVHFYKVLKDKPIQESFLNVDKPYFTESDEAHKSVIRAYALPVLKKVEEVAKKYEGQCLDLANAIAPKLSDVIAMQRGKYYDFGPYKKEFHVFDQAADIDRSPVNNMHMERRCGSVAGRLEKRQHLGAVCRAEILKGTQSLVDEEKIDDYRKLRKETENVKQLKLKWSERQQQLRSVGLEKKQADKCRVEDRKLSFIEDLKGLGGPFTSAEQVQIYMMDSSISENDKQSRLRKEVTVARDSSVSLPRSSPVFKIMNTNVKPRRLKTAAEFAEGLQIYLGKLGDRKRVTVDDFSSALKDLTA